MVFPLRGRSYNTSVSSKRSTKVQYISGTFFSPYFFFSTRIFRRSIDAESLLAYIAVFLVFLACSLQIAPSAGDFWTFFFYEYNNTQLDIQVQTAFQYDKFYLFMIFFLKFIRIFFFIFHHLYFISGRTTRQVSWIRNIFLFKPLIPLRTPHLKNEK